MAGRLKRANRRHWTQGRQLTPLKEKLPESLVANRSEDANRRLRDQGQAGLPKKSPQPRIVFPEPGYKLRFRETQRLRDEWPSTQFINSRSTSSSPSVTLADGKSHSPIRRLICSVRWRSFRC